eukprot:5335977-Pleurochrysis_carterae.AAC.1
MRRARARAAACSWRRSPPRNPRARASAARPAPLRTPSCCDGCASATPVPLRRATRERASARTGTGSRNVPSLKVREERAHCRA